jgi:hypothetical protein
VRQEDSVQVYFAPNIENRKVVNLANVVETFMDEEQRPQSGYPAEFDSLAQPLSAWPRVLDWGVAGECA